MKIYQKGCGNMSALGKEEKVSRGTLENLSLEIITNIRILFLVFYNGLLEAGVREKDIRNIVITPFPPNEGMIAYEIYAPLITSHARMWTVPEENKLGFDIAFCSKNANPDLFVAYLKKEFKVR